MDFASQWLENRRQARILGILDVCTRENLLLKAQPLIPASHLVSELSWLFLIHGQATEGPLRQRPGIPIEEARQLAKAHRMWRIGHPAEEA